MENDIRQLRERRGWSQTELARRLKCSRQHVIALEQGGDTKLALGMKVARVFRLPVERVFFPLGRPEESAQFCESNELAELIDA